MVSNPLIPAGLTSEEANLVYNLEILDMPVKLAASNAGVGVGCAVKPHIIQARETVRRALQSSMAITKEDVINGIREAIYDAKLTAEPMAQIKGWESIAGLLGFNQAKSVEININASIDVVKRQIRTVPDNELIKQLGADNVIDVDFYEKKE